ncbi:MAG: DUF368 domain-containing protein [Actinobacteria bacterium]|nr:DUF368 domain-containing protein [Actinomycetota bacterium]
MTEQKSVFREITRNVLRGSFMGAADAVPGVSGGTIALLLGIYERLLHNIQHCTNLVISVLRIDRATTKRSFQSVEWHFLLSLLSGVFITFVLLAQIIERLLEKHPTSVAGLFFGLVLASVIVAVFMVSSWNVFRVSLGLAVGITVFILLGVRAGPIQQPSLLIFFLSGAIAISAMILPGISGSFFLLMIGMYGSLIEAVNERLLSKLLVFGLGAVLSLSLSARLLSWILRNYRDSVLALLIGLMIGSLRVIWPWPNGVGVISSEENEVIEGSALAWPDSFSAFIWPVVFGLAGFIIIIFIWNLSRSDQ